MLRQTNDHKINDKLSMYLFGERAFKHSQISFFGLTNFESCFYKSGQNYYLHGSPASFGQVLQYLQLSHESVELLCLTALLFETEQILKQNFILDTFVSIFTAPIRTVTMINQFSLGLVPENVLL